MIQYISDDVLTVINNRVLKVFDKPGMFMFYPLCVHVNRYLMKTIIFLKSVTTIMGVRVTMETTREKQIIVQLGNGNIYKFNQCGESLYQFDTAEQEVFGEAVELVLNDGVEKFPQYIPKDSDNDKNNQYFLTKQETKRAYKARKPQQIIRCPSNTNFKSYIGKNLIESFVITVNDIKILE